MTTGEVYVLIQLGFIETSWIKLYSHLVYNAKGKFKFDDWYYETFRNHHFIR